MCMDNREDQYGITNLYYPGYSMKHSFTHAAFLSDFEDLVENVLCGNRKRIILGDFNIHTEDNSKPETLNLERILNKCSLILHETPKTHQLGGVIDLVISDENIVNEMSKPVVLSDYDDISDHYPVSLDIFFNPAGKKNKITVKCQKFSESHIRDIVALINESQDLMEIFECPSVDNMVQKYNRSISKICNDISPAIIKDVYQRSQQPWFTEVLRQKKREKRKSERKWLKNKNASNESDYKEICLDYYGCISRARNEYYTCILTTNSRNLKVVYNVVNKLSGDKQTSILPKTCSDTELANKFADYFDSKIKRIRENIVNDSNSTPTNVNRNTVATVLGEFFTLSLSELCKMFGDMSKKNYAKDPMPIKTFDKCFDSISPYILEIINKSLLEGVFPSELKHATISPIIKDKNADPDELKNYRPVSNTPILAKIIEKTVLTQINNHLELNNLHTETQSGYKKFHSCETALIKVVSDIQNEVRKNNIVSLLMLDLSAAFDTIDHRILIHRLKINFRIEGIALKWIESYLKNRTYSVIINSERREQRST